MKISKLYCYQFFNFLGGDFLIFQISWKRGQTWQTQLYERFERDIQVQKFIRLRKKSAYNFADLLLWVSKVIKLLTNFLKYKRNNKVWKSIKFGKCLLIPNERIKFTGYLNYIKYLSKQLLKNMQLQNFWWSLPFRVFPSEQFLQLFNCFQIVFKHIICSFSLGFSDIKTFYVMQGNKLSADVDTKLISRVKRFLSQ